jgi:thioredoxin 2
MIFPCPACDTANTLTAGQDPKSATCTSCSAPLFAGHPIHLTVEKFNAHVAPESPPLLIDFWADWCGPCKTMSPIFEALAGEFEPMVRFAKVNTDEQRQIAEYFSIQTIPTISLIHRQREVARSIGVLYTADLRRWIYGALSEPEGDTVKS